MSTTKGRSMRSKVEKRMARETGRTQRELRRAVKLRKKLMTDDERLIYSLRRVKAPSIFFCFLFFLCADGYIGHLGGPAMLPLRCQDQEGPGLP
jgi:hypothetical protein